MKKNSFLLTVAIPTYERQNTLICTLDSICNQVQDRSDIEIIVVDNCSVGYNIFLLLSDYVQRYNIKIFRNKVNLGIDGNVKCCIKNASGRFVWLFSDDDLMYEYSLNHVISTLHSNLNKGLCVVNYDIYDDECKVLLKDNIIKESHYDSSIMSNITFVTSVIVNKELYDKHIKHEYFDKFLGGLYYHMAIGIYLASISGYIFIPKPLIKFRSGCSSLGGTIDVAIEPFLIFKELNIKRKLSYHPSDFIRNNILLFIKDRKKKNKLKYEYIDIVFKYFCINVYSVYIFIIYLVPKFMLNFILTIKRIIK